MNEPDSIYSDPKPLLYLWDENGLPADLDLFIDMIQVFVTNDRAGLYGE